jgi:hypothetical protein
MAGTARLSSPKAEYSRTAGAGVSALMRIQTVRPSLSGKW